MNQKQREALALFRLAVLGELIHTDLRRGDLRRTLEARAAREWRDPGGRPRKISAKTIESWLYAYRDRGFEALLPEPRKDKGAARSIPIDLQELILDMKREDPGRSVPLILRELANAGRIRQGEISESAVRRLLRRRGLSGAKMQVHAVARHRFVAAECNELWQGDACHGPKLYDPRSGRHVRVKIFGLLDDKSRLVTYLRASFHERQEDFLRVLFESIRRRGVPRRILLDNHGSFTGADVRLVCAKLGIRLVHARPYDGASKGKIERFWRTLRLHVLDRIAPDAVLTLDDLNLRLATWLDGDYNVRGHGGLGGRTPLSVFEEEADGVRFVDDAAELDDSFVGCVERRVRNDATCAVAGTILELPQHLRGERVRLYYAVLRPGEYWIEDGGVRVPLRAVDVTANSHRARTTALPPSDASPKTTGMNAVEGLVERKLGSGAARRDDEKGGQSCAQS